MDALLNGFAVVATPANLLYCFIGCLLGTIVGILPGLGPLTTIAILLPITSILNVIGSRIAMVVSGPRPGRMPTTVPRKAPMKQ